jgi:hypothetical protein
MQERERFLGQPDADGLVTYRRVNVEENRVSIGRSFEDVIFALGTKREAKTDPTRPGPSRHHPKRMVYMEDPEFKFSEDFAIKWFARFDRRVAEIKSPGRITWQSLSLPSLPSCHE